MARTIQSPGVEIKEIDQSIRPVVPAGTNILVAGFADKGPTDEIIQVTSRSEFTDIYGEATVPAELYLSSTTNALLNSPANIFVYRMPYGTGKGIGFGNNYSVLAYPASAMRITKDKATPDVLTTFSDTVSAGLTRTVLIGEPKHFTLTQEQYFKIQQKDGFDWVDETASDFTSLADLGKAAILIVNKAQTTIDQSFQGFYVGAIDNTDLNPATDFNSIINIETQTTSTSGNDVKLGKNSFSILPTSRLDNLLSAKSSNNVDTFGANDNSISETMEELTDFDISTRQFDDTVSIGIFKLAATPASDNSINLGFTLEE